MMFETRESGSVPRVVDVVQGVARKIERPVNRPSVRHVDIKEH